MSQMILSTEQIQNYMNLAFCGERNAEEILIENYEPYISKVAQKILTNSEYSVLIDKSDLIQEGMVGLIYYVRHYNARNEINFLHQVKSSILTKMKAYVNKNLRMERKNVVGEISLHSCFALAYPSSLEKDVELKLLVEHLYDLNILTKREMRVLNLFYQYKYNSSDISQEFHMTKTNVNQCKKMALNKLKKYLVLNAIIETKNFKIYEKECFDELKSSDKLKYINEQINKYGRDLSELCYSLELDTSQIKRRISEAEKFIELKKEKPKEKKASSLKNSNVKNVLNVKRPISDKAIIDIASKVINGILLQYICIEENLDYMNILNLLRTRLYYLSIYLYDNLAKLGYIDLVKLNKQISGTLLSVYRKKISDEDLIYLASEIINNKRSLLELCIIYQLNVNAVIGLFQKKLFNLSKELYDELGNMGCISTESEKKLELKI